MNNQPGSSLEERKERGLSLLEQMLGTAKAEEVKAGWREIYPGLRRIRNRVPLR